MKNPKFELKAGDVVIEKFADEPNWVGALYDLGEVVGIAKKFGQSGPFLCVIRFGQDDDLYAYSPEDAKLFFKKVGEL